MLQVLSLNVEIEIIASVGKLIITGVGKVVVIDIASECRDRVIKEGVYALFNTPHMLAIADEAIDNLRFNSPSLAD